jgi:hypothetical protein
MGAALVVLIVALMRCERGAVLHQSINPGQKFDLEGNPL